MLDLVHLRRRILAYIPIIVIHLYRTRRIPDNKLGFVVVCGVVLQEARTNMSSERYSEIRFDAE